MKTKKTNRAKTNEASTKQVKNNVSVEVKAESESPVIDLPVVAETENGKVSSKDVLKAASSIRAAVFQSTLPTWGATACEITICSINIYKWHYATVVFLSRFLKKKSKWCVVID